MNKAKERYMAARDMLGIAGINIDELFWHNADYSEIGYGNATVALEHPELAPLVTHVNSLFAFKHLDSVNLTDYDFSNVIDAAGMFAHSTIHVINLGNSLRNVKCFSRMFKDAICGQLLAGGLNTRHGETFDSMFENCNALNVNIEGLVLNDLLYRTGMFDKFRCSRLRVNEQFITGFSFYIDWAAYKDARELQVVGDNGKCIQVFANDGFNKISLLDIRNAVHHALHDGTSSTAYCIAKEANTVKIYSVTL